jgi:ferredoxin
MFSPGDPGARHDTWRPAGTGWLRTSLAVLDRVFDRVYSSSANPLHRTGTLAVLCLAVTLVTGVYLLLVYEIARPYESVAAVQDDVLLGRWMRALHRYASDATVVAVVLHVLRVIVQGKTWGPRALAWVTGVVLTGMMWVSAITGFVLVWDGFGQKIAVGGARMLAWIPLFPEPPGRAFVGDAPVPPQFFFMNLFLHVAVPLGMVLVLWLHTARLARAAWFPERRVTIAGLAGLLVLSLAWPAPLPPKADLLAVPGRIATDWFYGFWLPVVDASPGGALLAVGTLAALLLAGPWLLAPSRRRRPAPAVADPETCEGCEQCLKDCPYDAIRMVAGAHPERYPLRADVQPDLCVSCGLCAASCASLAIGPPGRTALTQLADARQLVALSPGAAGRALLILCRNNAGLADRLRRDGGAAGPVRFEVDCAGTLHPGTVAYLGRHFSRTLVLACPPHACLHREGATLAELRILGERRPAVPGQLARLPVRVLSASVADWPCVATALEALGRGGGTRPRWLAPTALTTLLLALLALGSRAPQGADAEHGVLRLGWRLVGQTREQCRDLTAEEQAARPLHMRQARECVSEVLTYDLTASVDGQTVLRRRVRSPGLRADRPLSVDEEVTVEPGQRHVAVTFAPADPDSGGAVLRFERPLRFERGRVALLTLAGDRLERAGPR